MKETIHQIYPQAKYQHCCVHISRNLAHKVRVKDRKTIYEDFKAVYQVSSKKDVIRYLALMKDRSIIFSVVTKKISNNTKFLYNKKAFVSFIIKLDTKIKRRKQMLQYKDIKNKDQNLDTNLKNLLNIKDPHIFFSAQAVQKEAIHHQMTNVFYGVLTYTPKACEYCGIINEENVLIKHSPKASDIQLIPYQEAPSILRLFKQRFYCKAVIIPLVPKPIISLKIVIFRKR